MMLTKFGALVRKLRMDRGLLLGDMADALNVTSSFLSAVETGKKSVPETLSEKIVTWLCLDKKTAIEVRKAALESLREVRFNVENASLKDRDLAVTFAKQFNSLTAEEREKMMAILKNKKERV